MNRFQIVLPKITKRPAPVAVGTVDAAGHIRALQYAIDEWPDQIKGTVDVIGPGRKKGTQDVKRFRVTWSGKRGERRAEYEAMG